MNTNRSGSETKKDMDYTNQLMWQSGNIRRNRYEQEEVAQVQRDKNRESFLCVVSFIAIVVLAWFL